MALTVEKQAYGVVGNYVLLVYKITGDGTSTSFVAQVKRVVSAWVGNGNENAGYNPQLSWSGNAITYGTAPTNNKYHYLHILGTP